jgi:hypothetical protein
MMPLTSNKTFTETQKYDEPRVRYTAAALSVLVVIGLTYSFASPVHTVPDGIIWGSLLGLCIMSFADMFIFFKSLFIKVDGDGIMLKEKPSKTEILCNWENIDQIIFRYYKYGIWGIKSSRKQGMAYNLKGKAGIQIIFKNGQKLQLGIQNIGEAKLVIDHYFKAGNF